MSNLTYRLGLLVLVMAAIGAPASSEIIPTSGVSSMTGSYNGWGVTIMGCFTTQAAAVAARDSYHYTSPPNPECSPDPWDGIAESAGMIDPAKWGSVGKRKGQAHMYFPCGSGTNQFVQWIWAKVPGVYVDNGPAGDIDGDGLPNWFDPYDNDASPFQWKFITHQVDEQGRTTYALIQTDKGDKITYGTYDPDKLNYIGIGEAWHGPSELLSQLYPGDGSMPVLGTADIKAPNIPDLVPRTGEDNTGNTAEVDYLADVVTNTQRMVEALGEANERLKGLQEGILAGNVLEGANQAGGGGGTSSAGVAEGVGQALDDQAQEAQEALTGANWGESPVFEGYGQGDIPTKPKTLGQVLTAGFAAHPLAHLADQVGYQGSGAVCSFNFEVYGQTITFSLCDYENILTIMGGILLGITSLWAIMICIGRG